MTAKAASKTRLAEETAERLSIHLKRMEADKRFNESGQHGAQLFMAHAYADRGHVKYVGKSYQGTSVLDVSRALAWVEWLDQGNSGLYYKFDALFPAAKVHYVSIPDAEHRHQFDGLRGRRYLKLEEAFYQWLHLMFPAVPKPVNGSVHELCGWNFGKGHAQPTFHIMTEEQQKAIEKLFSEIRDGLDTSFNDGKKDGQDFISQMVRGEITIDDFGINGRPAKRGYAGRLGEE